jgi:hypothetical protein
MDKWMKDENFWHDLADGNVQFHNMVSEVANDVIILLNVIEKKGF